MEVGRRPRIGRQRPPRYLIGKPWRPRPARGAHWSGRATGPLASEPQNLRRLVRPGWQVLRTRVGAWGERQRFRDSRTRPHGTPCARRRCRMRPMPRVPPLDRPAAYADLEQLPPNMVAEIVDDELWASPRPAPRHSRAWARLTSRIEPAFDEGRGGPGGWIILGEPEIHLGRQVLVPDLAGWRRSRLPRLPATAHVAVAPDWV